MLLHTLHVDPLTGVLQNGKEGVFRAACLRLVAVLPPCRERKGHHDRLNSSTRLEAELCSSVVDEVELGVPASPERLPLLLLLGEGRVPPLVHYGSVGGHEALTHVLHKLEPPLFQLLGCLLFGLHLLHRVAILVAHLLAEVIEEDATHPSALSSVSDAKVVIAPLLEGAVVGLCVLFVSFCDVVSDGLVEVHSILLIQVGRREVRPATKPPYLLSTFFVRYLEVAVVGVRGRCMRVVRVNNEAHTAREELGSNRLPVGILLQLDLLSA
mmetsp:Transcript_49725/g.127902  ORF Transcript_49725/g.127902 Transcript_49725/m.127902 type:complete len:269 (+) Transcript_49725:1543-2349(+)